MRARAACASFHQNKIAALCAHGLKQGLVASVQVLSGRLPERVQTIVPRQAVHTRLDCALAVTADLAGVEAEALQRACPAPTARAPTTFRVTNGFRVSSCRLACGYVPQRRANQQAGTRSEDLAHHHGGHKACSNAAAASRMGHGHGAVDCHVDQASCWAQHKSRLGRHCPSAPLLPCPLTCTIRGHSRLGLHRVAICVCSATYPLNTSAMRSGSQSCALAATQMHFRLVMQNYMANDSVCRAAVMEYADGVLVAKVGGGMRLAKSRTADTEASLFGGKPPVSSAAIAQPAQASSTAVRGNAPSAEPREKTPQQATASSSASVQTTAQQQTRPDSTSSTRAAAQPAVKAAAVTVTTGAKPKGKGARKGEPAAPRPARAALQSLERQVFNCLACGKVYDCRTVTQDGLDLMSAGGACIFCHQSVPVAVSACRNEPGTRATPAQEITAAAAPTDASQDESQKAREYADRMIEYDRTANKRTAVIDDQGDFYEIEGNAWLSPEERNEMKQRQVLEERVREQRRNRMVVSVDLIGRTVRRHQFPCLQEGNAHGIVCIPQAAFSPG